MASTTSATVEPSSSPFLQSNVALKSERVFTRSTRILELNDEGLLPLTTTIGASNDADNEIDVNLAIGKITMAVCELKLYQVEEQDPDTSLPASNQGGGGLEEDEPMEVLLPSGCPPPMTAINVPLQRTRIPTTSTGVPGVSSLIHPQALTIAYHEPFLPTKAGSQRVTAMLLYNLGLALHIEALKEACLGPSRIQQYEVCIKGAIQMQEMAFLVVNTYWEVFPLVEDVVLLLRTICQNKGILHSLLGDAERSTACFNWVQLCSDPTFKVLLQGHTKSEWKDQQPLTVFAYPAAEEGE